jgi:hypothetical protein
MICVVQEKSALCDAFQEFQDRLRAMSELKMNLENALRRLRDDSFSLHSLRGLHERRRELKDCLREKVQHLKDFA